MSLRTLVQAGAGSPVLQYPFTYEDLKDLHPETSFPEPEVLRWEEWNVFPVTPVAQPVIDHTQRIREINPVWDGTQYVQTWEVWSIPQADIDRYNQKMVDEAAVSDVKVDNWVATFLQMDRAAVEAYVDANVANMGEARDLLKKMAVILRVLAVHTIGRD